MSTKAIPYVIGFVVLGGVCLWSLTIGLILTGLVALLWLISWSGQQQNAQYVKKYGPELAKKIGLRQVELGMPREVVELIWGPAGNIKRSTTAAGVTMHCDHSLVQGEDGSHYKYYAIYKNDLLTEFGDK